MTTRKAGGLYGGIQFSSATTFTPSTVEEPTPTVIPVEEDPVVKKLEEVAAVVEAGRDGGSSVPETASGKSTAGIPLLL